MNSEVFVCFNLTEKLQIIGGTWYGGEMKKGMFAMMNYYLPLRGMASMHCSANVGKDGDVAVFFGLSGTGKTTLLPTRNVTLSVTTSTVGMTTVYLTTKVVATLRLSA